MFAAVELAGGGARRLDGKRLTERIIGAREVDFAAAEWDRLLDVNTPEDLAMARAVAVGET